MHARTVHGGVVVELLDLGDEVRLGHVLPKLRLEARDAHLLAGLDLHPDVGGRVRAVAHQHDGEARRHARLGLERRRLLLDLGPDGLGDGLACSSRRGRRGDEREGEDDEGGTRGFRWHAHIATRPPPCRGVCTGIDHDRARHVRTHAPSMMLSPCAVVAMSSSSSGSNALRCRWDCRA